METPAGNLKSFWRPPPQRFCFFSLHAKKTAPEPPLPFCPASNTSEAKRIAWPPLRRPRTPSSAPRTPRLQPQPRSGGFGRWLGGRAGVDFFGGRPLSLPLFFRFHGSSQHPFRRLGSIEAKWGSFLVYGLQSKPPFVFFGTEAPKESHAPFAPFDVWDGFCPSQMLGTRRERGPGQNFSWK